MAKKQFESASKLFSYCTEMYEEKTSPLNAFIVFPIDDISPERVSKAAKRRKLKFSIINTAKNIYLVKVGVRDRIASFQLVVNKGWWLFLGDGKTRVLHDVLLESFINIHFSWALEPAYIDSSQLTQILDDLALRFDSVSITDCRYYQPGVTTIEFRRRGFQIPHHAGILRELEDNTNGTLSAVKLQFSYPNTRMNKVRIQTQSQLTFYGGFFTDFYQSIILPYVEQGLKSRERFSNKERKIEPSRVILSTTTIKYGKEFEPEQIEKLQKVLVSQYSTSIVYYNPVMIAHITDRRDGSCFDIYLNHDSIQVVPLTRATSGSFTQLLSLLARYTPQVIDVLDEFYPTPS